MEVILSLWILKRTMFPLSLSFKASNFTISAIMCKFVTQTTPTS